MYKIVTAPRTDPLDYRKMGISGSVLAVVVIAALAIPLPLHEETAFLIEPTDVAKVYASTPGRVSEVFVEPGSHVTKGQLLVRLTNDEKEQKRRSLEMDRSLQLKDVDLDHALEDQAKEQVDKDRLNGIEKQLKDKERELCCLRSGLRATAWSWLPPEPSRDDVRRQLSRWYGTPLDPQTFGCYLTERTPILGIAPSATSDAILYIDQGDRDDFSVGQEVQIKLEHIADRTYYGTIKEISGRSRRSLRRVCRTRREASCKRSPTNRGTND